VVQLFGLLGHTLLTQDDYLIFTGINFSHFCGIYLTSHKTFLSYMYCLISFIPIAPFLYFTPLASNLSVALAHPFDPKYRRWTRSQTIQGLYTLVPDSIAIATLSSWNHRALIHNISTHTSANNGGLRSPVMAANCALNAAEMLSEINLPGEFSHDHFSSVNTNQF